MKFHDMPIADFDDDSWLPCTCVECLPADERTLVEYRTAMALDENASFYRENGA